MCIDICIIYVHDDVDVNVYVDGYASVLVDWYMYVPMDMKMIMIIVIVCVYVYKYLYMHEPQNENWFVRL